MAPMISPRVSRIAAAVKRSQTPFSPRAGKKSVASKASSSSSDVSYLPSYHFGIRSAAPSPDYWW